MKMSFNVVSSEVCCYNQNPAHALYGCGCPSHADPNFEGDITDHLKFEGATKKAIFGIIGPDSQKKHVFDRLAMLGPRAEEQGVYTLMISQFDCDREDISDGIRREIATFQSVAAADPTGEFTPLLLHSCVISRESKDFETLITISDQVNVYGHDNHLNTLIRHYSGDIYLLYVTNSGATLTKYIRHLNSYNNTRPMVTPPDVVAATQKLADDYQKLAKKHVGHYDMHTNNITYIVENNKLSLKIIDFGLNDYARDGQTMNVLHFFFGIVYMGDTNTYQCIRACDPIHYNLFVACFEVMRRCLLVNKDKSIQKLLEIVHTIGKNLFVNEGPVSTQRETKSIVKDLNSMMGVDRHRRNGYATRLASEFESYIDNIVSKYSGFFNLKAIQEIWVRVCSKVSDVLDEYYHLHPTLIDDICKRSSSAVNEYYDVYPGDVCTEKYELEIYPVIFDRFCMAFYDKPTGVLDHNFLKKKFDEYSIAVACCSLLTNLADTFYTYHDQNVRTEIHRLKSNFVAPIFFIHNDDVDHMGIDDHMYLSTLPLVTSAASHVPYFVPPPSNSDRMESPLGIDDHMYLSTLPLVTSAASHVPPPSNSDRVESPLSFFDSSRHPAFWH